MEANVWNSADNFIKAKGLTLDMGKIKSEKHGEATVSVRLLFMSHEEIPPRIHEEALSKLANVWIKEMGLENYKQAQIFSPFITSLVVHTSPDSEAEKTELLWKVSLFSGFFDDGIMKLRNINKTDPTKHYKDIADLMENFVLIVKSHGDSDVTEAAISKLNPALKLACVTLKYSCQCAFQQMATKDYEHFEKELVEFIKVNKWLEEHYNLPLSKKDYLDLRYMDVFVGMTVHLICYGKNIRLPDEIRKHPIFLRFYKNLASQAAICNDIFSLSKEINQDEATNLVLIYNQKYSLQKSIRKTEKLANKYSLYLQKDKIRLLSYFPNSDSLKNFIIAAEHLHIGAYTWSLYTPRYSDRKWEVELMEYRCDYNRWLEQIEMVIGDGMDETRSSIESRENKFPSIFD